MKARPILFSAPMVRAILAGTKTQTRRIIKPRHDDGVITGAAAQPFHAIESWGGGQWNRAAHSECLCCPYGVPAALDSDRLWVRETFRFNEPNVNGLTCIEQFASDGDVNQWWVVPPEHCAKAKRMGGPWKPSIFMPRWASRITLEIVDVRVERLQDISEADARAEGCCGKTCTQFGLPNYRYVWESINGVGSWALSPWVWCISFRRL